MCDKQRTCVFKLLLVAALLIQHVVHVADASAESVAAGSAASTASASSSLAAASLLKRDIIGLDSADEAISNSNSNSFEAAQGAQQRKADTLVDFAAYVNDFNIQEEASIPEDILDQQHMPAGVDADATAEASVQYGDAEVADIILASQRYNPKNFTFYEDNRNHQHYHKGLKNNNRNAKNNRKEFKNGSSNQQPEVLVMQAETEKNAKEFVFLSKESGTTQNKKHSNVYDQQRAEQQQRLAQHQQKNTDADRDNEDGEGSLQLESFELLNERKFNKVSLEENKKSPDDVQHDDNDDDDDAADDGSNNKDTGDNSRTAGDTNLDDAAIGDIIDNFRNEDEEALAESASARVVDRDESVADETAAESPKAKPTDFIARKIKRHDGSRAFNDDDTQRQQKQHFDNLPHSQQRYSKQRQHAAPNDMQAHESGQAAMGRHPTNSVFASNLYFGIVKNTTNSEEDNQPAYGVVLRDTADKDGSADEVGRSHNKAHAAAGAGEQQEEKEAAETAESAFERHKAMRRNNKHYGHRSHKKKYKDYLRHEMTTEKVTRAATPATITTMSATNGGRQRAAVVDNDRNAINAATTKARAAAAAATATETIKLTNQTNSNDDGQVARGAEQTATGRAQQRAEKLSRKVETEQKLRGLPASPIFVVSNRNVADNRKNNNNDNDNNDKEHSEKPFYEGQINYYVETDDDDVEGAERQQQRLSSSSSIHEVPASHNNNNNNLYGRVSPALRNGIKSTNAESKQQQRYHQHRKHQHHHQQHHQRNHHHHQRSHHHHNHHHQQQQHDKRYHPSTEQRIRNAHQRRLLPAPPAAASTTTSTVLFGVREAASGSTSPPSTAAPVSLFRKGPHAGAMQELGHQITEIKELERYYAKWPHLARVQLQVYDEHYREAHPELYTDYDEEPEEDYESAAELEEAQSGHDEDANLPPYIKKYNRRNKQLLNLLEGTLPPATRPPPPLPALPALRSWSSSQLQPGPRDSSAGGAATVLRINDDDYLQEKRRRYRVESGRGNNNRHFYDLFAEQRGDTQPNTTAADAVERPAVPTEPPNANRLPDEDLSISQEFVDAEADGDMWQTEMKSKSNAGSEKMTWQIEKLTTAWPTPEAPAAPTTPKAAVFKLPSYPAFAGSFVAKPRSRSAQFAPSASASGSSRGNGIIGAAGWHGNSNSYNNYNNFKSMPRYTAYADSAKSSSLLAAESSGSGSDSSTQTPAPPDADNPPPPAPPSKPINSFIYHRVVEAAPRLVGAGSTGRKQRLPFVAITDRRLETSKRAMLERQKDFEQNHFPMP